MTLDSIRLPALQACAKILANAAIHQQWIDVPSAELMPTSLDEAYQIQDMATLLRNDVAQGWKIGATNPMAQQLFSVIEPFAGRVFRNDIYQSPAEVKRVRPDMLTVEAEFAFTMRYDLPSRTSAYSREEVMAAVAMVHPAIEYVQSRYKLRGKLEASKSIADNAGQGALILGRGVVDWKALNLPSTAVRVLVDEKEICAGSGAEVLGDPVICLVWLANFLSSRGLGLKANEVITTGTCTRPFDAPPNTNVVAQFDGLDDVCVTFVVPG